MMNLSMNPLYDHDPGDACQVFHPGLHREALLRLHQGFHRALLTHAGLHEEQSACGQDLRRTGDDLLYNIESVFSTEKGAPGLKLGTRNGAPAARLM